MEYKKVGKFGCRNPHVSLRKLSPSILKIHIVLPNNGEAGTVRNIEACSTNDGVDFACGPVGADDCFRCDLNGCSEVYRNIRLLNSAL